MKALVAGAIWNVAPESCAEIIQLLLDQNPRIDLFMAAATGRTSLIESILDRDSSVLEHRSTSARS
jgi:hypothetical protein